ncbi:MAG: hypothetical protein JRF53_00510 [Deltaproteobacteria bacterium]|nr:hypothetical protein [Deltaproteobacteria bacterium]
MTIELAEKRKKRFSDFATEPPVLDGDKVKLDTILNQEIEIVGYRIGDSNYSKNKSGKYLTLQIKIEHEVKIVFTGSDVLIKQIEKYGNEIPFSATIKKINRYYIFS